MKEIFRFTQSRPSEILPKSELNSFGLYVYPDEKKSEFLNDIKNLDTNNTRTDSLGRKIHKTY